MRSCGHLLNFIALFFGLYGSLTCESSLYRGSKIYELKVKPEFWPDFVKEVQFGSGTEFFDILKQPRKNNDLMSLMVHKKGDAIFRKLVAKFSAIVTTVDNDVERSVLEEKFRNNRKSAEVRYRRFAGRLRHNRYLTFNDMVAYLKVFRNSSKFAELEEIGTTYENRSILLLKVSRNNSLPIIWIDAGIHAREWIAPATSFYFIDKLLSMDGGNFLKKYQFYIVPNVNPDGYVYSYNWSRYWRKNREKSSKSNCFGVDLNRNFPFKWGEQGASNRSCSEIYRGAEEGDQLETKALIKKLKSIRDRVKLYLTLHSYGQYVLTPYGYEAQQYPPNYQKMIEMAMEIIHRMRRYHGTVYTTGSAADLLYAASGGSDDYVCGELGIPYSYTIELPDYGSYNFLLPPAYIPVVGEQIWTAMSVLVENM